MKIIEIKNILFIEAFEKGTYVYLIGQNENLCRKFLASSVNQVTKDYPELVCVRQRGGSKSICKSRLCNL